MENSSRLQQNILKEKVVKSVVTFVKGIKRLSNAEEFIAKARKIHGEKYDYSKVIYTGIHNKV